MWGFDADIWKAFQRFVVGEYEHGSGTREAAGAFDTPHNASTIEVEGRSMVECGAAHVDNWRTQPSGSPCSKMTRVAERLETERNGRGTRPGRRALDEVDGNAKQRGEGDTKQNPQFNLIRTSGDEDIANRENSVARKHLDQVVFGEDGGT